MDFLDLREIGVDIRRAARRRRKCFRNRAAHAIGGEGRKSLYEGQKVQFTVSQGQKGPQAENIVVL